MLFSVVCDYIECSVSVKPTCPELSQPTHATLRITEDIARYKCHDGYAFRDGSVIHTRVCPDKQWSGDQPHCEGEDDYVKIHVDGQKK